MNDVLYSIDRRWNLTLRIVLSLSLQLVSSMSVVSALASDHMNLEEQLPTDLEDALPSEYKIPELQSASRYEHTREGGDRFVLQERMEYGFAPNWHVKVGVPFLLGSADKTGSGNVDIELLKALNAETELLPIFALEAGADFPTGFDSRGVNTGVKFLATKTVGESATLPRLHFNLSWVHNIGGTADQRRDRYIALLGFSRFLPGDNVLVMNVGREQELEKDKTANLVEAGLRRMFMERSVISVGAGAGLGADAPRFRVTVGFQYIFE